MSSKEKPSIYWSLLEFADWNFYLAATLKGLCYVGSQNKPYEELAIWVEKHFPGSPLVEDNQVLEPYVSEIKEYLAGGRESFNFAADLRGTPFQVAVWNAVCEIPFGETKSYSDIAHMVKRPAAVRAVGTAIGANPVLLSVPCHRVLGKNGALTGFRGGLDMKAKLLELEGQTLLPIKRVRK